MFDPDAYPELIYADAADRVKSLQRQQAALVARQVRSQQRRQQVLTLLRIKRTTTKRIGTPA